MGVVFHRLGGDSALRQSDFCATRGRQLESGFQVFPRPGNCPGSSGRFACPWNPPARVSRSLGILFGSSEFHGPAKNVLEAAAFLAAALTAGFVEEFVFRG